MQLTADFFFYVVVVFILKLFVVVDSSRRAESRTIQLFCEGMLSLSVPYTVNGR